MSISLHLSYITRLSLMILVLMLGSYGWPYYKLLMPFSGKTDQTLLHGEHTRRLFCLSMHYSLDRLALYCLIGLLKLLTEIFPYFLDLSSTIIEFHRTNLSYYDMMIEAAIIALVLICKCHVRWIRLHIYVIVSM